MYAHILRWKAEKVKFLRVHPLPKKKRKKGKYWQEVPMDINKINASLEATRKPHLI